MVQMNKCLPTSRQDGPLSPGGLGSSQNESSSCRREQENTAHTHTHTLRPTTCTAGHGPVHRLREVCSRRLALEQASCDSSMRVTSSSTSRVSENDGCRGTPDDLELRVNRGPPRMLPLQFVLTSAQNNADMEHFVHNRTLCRSVPISDEDQESRAPFKNLTENASHTGVRHRRTCQSSNN